MSSSSPDLLDRLVTDARLRARSAAERAKPEWHPSGSYGAALQEQLRSEEVSPVSSSDGPGEVSSGQQVKRANAPALPRALICVTTETFCTNCGARYRAPGYAILAEYSTNNVSVNRTMDDVRRLERYYSCRMVQEYGREMPKLPKEHRTLTVHAPACEACF